MSEKDREALRTIGEVADELELPQHVLRFWETKFPQIRPMKRAGGRRYYRPDDIELLRAIRHLLYAKGFTIRGVQRLLKENGRRKVAASPDGTASTAAAPSTLPAATAGEMPAGPGTAGIAPGSSQPKHFSIPAPSTRPEAAERAEQPALPSRESQHASAAEHPERMQLTKNERSALEGVLLELLELKRRLDQVR